MAKPKGEKRGPGRPSLYTPELGQAICDRLAKGEPLAVICRDEAMPAYRTVSDWKAAHPEFSAEFGRARDIGYDMIAHRTRMTARGDDVHGDSKGDVQRDKLIIETDLKLLAKWDPRRYGDKIDVNHGGGIGITITPTDAEL